MTTDHLSHWVASCLVLGLRIGPIFAFAPPFSLVRMPLLFRVFLGLGLSICLVSAHPQTTILSSFSLSTIFAASTRELMLGIVFMLAFQLAFAALYFAGRTIDIQAGYGLALLIDPVSQSQAPLVGTLFAWAAGAVFFSMNGHLDILRLMTASLDAVPLGTWSLPGSIAPLTSFISVVFLSALGIAGATILVLFVIDMVIAMLSRTVPQMNVLILGFQVKTIVLLLVLPTSFGIAGALLVRLMAASVRALPELL